MATRGTLMATRWEFRLRRTYKGVSLGRVGISWYAIGADRDLDGNPRDLWIANSYAGAKRWVNSKTSSAAQRTERDEEHHFFGSRDR
jgi:hypothetical protein